ncbi:MAG: response regulator transcription factor [Chloroflexia bacterium]|nr:response regulator transcription factor [Chloroflexia bacterium]
MVRVLVVSPFPTVRAGLRALVEGHGDLVVAEARMSVDQDGLASTTADVALIDGEADIAAIAALARARPDLGVVLMGGKLPGDLTVGHAARGYLRRDAGEEEILAAVRAVARGLTVVDPVRIEELLAPPEGRQRVQPPEGETLTRREMEVLQLIADGLPNKTIATQLGISEHTAKFHVSSVLSKLGAFSRTEAVSTAARRGLLVL